MANFVVHTNKHYVTMGNYHLKDRNLSLKAKGLLSVMLSLPEEWNYSISGLVAISKESETAIKSTLKELKEFGYIKITRLHDVDGRYNYKYDIYEEPITNNITKDELPEVENQPMENPPLETHPLKYNSPRENNLNNINTCFNTSNVLNTLNKFNDINNTSAGADDVCFLTENVNAAYRLCLEYCQDDDRAKDFSEVVGYFLKSYERKFNVSHNTISVNSWNKIIESYFTDTDTVHRTDEIDTDTYHRMIDEYFTQGWRRDIRLSLSHFFSSGIRDTLFERVGQY